jgi:hypothetical protein
MALNIILTKKGCPFLSHTMTSLTSTMKEGKVVQILTTHNLKISKYPLFILYLTKKLNKIITY